MSEHNTPGAVRTEDELPLAEVHSWLKQQVDDLPDEYPRVGQFPAGASNLTYQLDYPDRQLILRRPPTGTKAGGAHDVVREAGIQQLIAPDFPWVPEIIAICSDAKIIGTDFYVMQRVPGMIVRGSSDADTLSPQRAEQLSREAVTMLARLHQMTIPDSLQFLDKGPRYVQRQVEGWIRRYDQARTPDVPSFTKVAEWLRANQPADREHCLIHNDFRLDNLVVDPQSLQIRALLDWELATIGDPLMDLGSSLAYWVQSDDDAGMQVVRLQPTHLPGMLTREQVVAAYEKTTGTAVDDWTFYEVFGLFRLAGIAQQIYYRYFHQQTTNTAFAGFGQWVSYCESRCERLIR